MANRLQYLDVSEWTLADFDDTINNLHNFRKILTAGRRARKKEARLDGLAAEAEARQDRIAAFAESTREGDHITFYRGTNTNDIVNAHVTAVREKSVTVDNGNGWTELVKYSRFVANLTNPDPVAREDEDTAGSESEVEELAGASA